jgi:DNA-binding transcriptional LysR family regulator
MQVESLKVFCDVVESQSFSKAAVLNFISQSAVSQQIRSLEEKYEQKLIERGKRNLTPTQAGQFLYETAKEVLARLEALEQRVQKISRSVSGTVRVATIYSVGLHELHPYLSDFMRRFPGVHVRVEYDRSNRIYDAVASNAIDVGIVAYPARRSGVDILPFKSDELVLVCYPTHALAQLKKVEIKQLEGQDFVSFERDIPTRRAVDRILRDQDVKVNIVMELDNIDTIKRAVEIGSGIAILPRKCVTPEVALQTLTAVEFAGERHMRPLGLLVKRGREIPTAMQRLLDVLTR